MSNFITNLLLIKDQNITIEDKLDLINVDGQDTFLFPFFIQPQFVQHFGS